MQLLFGPELCTVVEVYAPFLFRFSMATVPKPAPLSAEELPVPLEPPATFVLPRRPWGRSGPACPRPSAPLTTRGRCWPRLPQSRRLRLMLHPCSHCRSNAWCHHCRQCLPLFAPPNDTPPLPGIASPPPFEPPAVLVLPLEGAPPVAEAVRRLSCHRSPCCFGSYCRPPMPRPWTESLHCPRHPSSSHSGCWTVRTAPPKSPPPWRLRTILAQHRPAVEVHDDSLTHAGTTGQRSSSDKKCAPPRHAVSPESSRPFSSVTPDNRYHHPISPVARPRRAGVFPIFIATGRVRIRRDSPGDRDVDEVTGPTPTRINQRSRRSAFVVETRETQGRKGPVESEATACRLWCGREESAGMT